MYKKIKLKRIAITTLVLIVVGVVFAVAVYANEEEEVVFDTKEQEGSVLSAKEGQQQVRLVQLKKMKEERIAEEKRIAEKERLDKEKRIAEENRIAKEKQIAEENRIAEEKRLAEKAKEEENVVTVKSETKADNSTVSTASSSSAPAQTGSNLGTFQATAYGPDCYGCSGVTANGTDIRNGNIYSGGYRVIAADPRVIPMNSIVKITYSSGQTEMAIVADTGGAIKGNIIDIAFSSEAEANPFGRQQVQLELIK